MTPPLQYYCKQMLAKSRKGVVMNRAYSNVRKYNSCLQDTVGFEIPRNTLRHSYGSQHLVFYERAQLTVAEMGHYFSKVNFNHNTRAVNREQAVRC